MRFVIGADIGGTSTKIAVTDDSGRLVAYRTGPGGNLRSSEGDVGANIASTLRLALSGLAPADVVAGHFGVAGAGPANHARVDALCQELWSTQGLRAPLTVQTDLEIAFASAADSGDGLLLLAGTGAVACTLSGFAMTGRSDGMGWLLGDVGSAVWLGVQALGAAAAALDHRGPATSLSTLVLDHLGIPAGPDPRQDLIAAVYPLPVAEHGRIAPLVVTAAEAGDDVARKILDEGVAGLLATAAGALADKAWSGSAQPRSFLAGARSTGAVPAGSTPTAAAPSDVVLAGSLLTSAGPVRDLVRPQLAAQLGVAESQLREASAPVVGALHLAAAAAGLPAVDRALLTAAVQEA